MAINLRDKITGELIKVNNSIIRPDGSMWVYNKAPLFGKRWHEKYSMLTETGRVVGVAPNLCLEVSLKLDGLYEVAQPTKPQRTRKPRAPKVTAASEPEPSNDPSHVIDAQAGMSIDAIERELCDKYGAMGADIFKAVVDVCGVQEPKSVSTTHTINVVTPNGTYKVTGKVNKDFGIFCNLVQAGKPLYMYGPAGSGKSYTAKQIADALGFDYYETSQAMFAHELKGYGDAKGDFVETAFYRAFRFGGVFFLDEVDASAPEALVVLNNAIANKRFDFPVIGNIDAHPNFRVIAAGNTRMTGATIEYTARQMQDTSFKNRFFFAAVTYDRNVMLDITGGNEEIVNFGADLRRAARETGISQLFSYRQAKDLATLQTACEDNDVYLLRGSVLQEKEIDDTVNLYEHLSDKSNRWAVAMQKAIEEMRNEEIW